MSEPTKYQIKCKLRKGDQVQVLSGGQRRGQTGKVERVDRKHGRVYVSGVNLAKRHTKPSVANPQGGITDKVMPLPIAAVALVDPKTKKPTRIGYKLVEGKKVRCAKDSGTVLAN